MIAVHNKGVRSKLAGTSAITTALGGTAIYFAQAPSTVLPPYIVVSIASGGDSNDSPKANADMVYTVKCVAADAALAGSVADLIRTTLHDATLSLDGGWGNYRCQHQAAFMYPENVERTQYWHAGGNYRIRSQYVG